MANFTEEELKKIDELRGKVNDCKSLYVRTDNVFLSKYLCCREWDVDNTMDFMITSFKFKTAYPRWYINRPVKEYYPLIEKKFKVLWSRKDKYGGTMYFIVVSKFPLDDFYSVNPQIDDIFVQLALENVDVQRNTLCVIVDFKDLPLKLLKWCSINKYKIVGEKSKVMPVRRLEIHVYNSSAIVENLIKLFKQFLPEFVQSQIFIHENEQSLHDRFGQENLPEEYGGPKGQSMYSEDLVQLVHNHEKLLNDTINHRYVDPTV